MATPAFALVGQVGAVAQGASGAAVTPAWGTGSGQQAGSLLLCWVASQGSATLPSTPAGWSVGQQTAGTSCSCSLFYKLAAGGDGAPTIALVTGAVLSAQLAEFSGAAASSPLHMHVGNANVTGTLNATMQAAASAGELMVYVSSAFYSVAATASLVNTLTNGAPSNDSNNNAVSTVDHYGFGYGADVAVSAADKDTFTYPTANITGAVLVFCSFKLAAPIPAPQFLPRQLGPKAVGPTFFAVPPPIAPRAAGPQALSQPLSGVLTFTGAQARNVTTLLAAVLSFTGARAVALIKLLAAVLAFTGARAVTVGHGLSATLTLTGAQARAIRTLLAAALSFTGARTVRVLKLLAGAGLTFTGAITRQTAKGLGAAVSFTGASRRAIVKTMTAGLSSAGAVSRQIAKRIAATASLVGQLLSNLIGSGGIDARCRLTDSPTVPVSVSQTVLTPCALRSAPTAPDALAATALTAVALSDHPTTAVTLADAPRNTG